MNTNYLEEFVYLAETLSFGKTADHFYTSRSVISRHVAALEKELGVRLLERDRHSVSLTKEGAAFCREARVIIKDFQRLIECTRDASDGKERIVRIGYLRNAARPYIVHFANYLKEHYEFITTAFSCMTYKELRESMDEGRIDLALSMDFDDDRTGLYKSLCIYEDQFYAVLSTTDPLASHEEGLTCGDLAGRRLLLSNSLMGPGLGEHLVQTFGAKSAFIAFEAIDDIDVAQLRLQVDGSIVLRSGYNVPLSGAATVALPLLDVDLSFKGNAHYRKDLDPVVTTALKKALIECSNTLPPAQVR